MRKLFAALLSAALILTLTTGAMALEVPQFTGRVNDLADMISPAVEQQLDAALAELDKTDSTQVAILTIPSLEGDSLEDFSIRVADAWKVGQKGSDNGVILLVSKGDRKVRIEVGYGLEGVLTDVLAGQIIDQVISPAFKTGNFDQGFAGGVVAITKAVRGEFTAVQKSTKRKRGTSALPFIVLIMASMIFLTEKFGRRKGRAEVVRDPKTGKVYRRSSGVGSAASTLFLLSMLSGGSRGGGGGFGGGGFGGFGGGGFGGGGASGDW